MKTTLFSILALALTPLALAGPRSSADYAVFTDVVDGGGAPAASVNYTNDGSVGGVTGLSMAVAPAALAKHGYIGQLYKVVDLAVAAVPATVDEGATRQLDAMQVLDDDTFIALDPGVVTWSVESGPLTGVSSAGLATADVVYADTPAGVLGSYQGETGTETLIVVNVGGDDFGTYALDGLPDNWQVQYFGLDNPDAGPAVDPDGDGQDNLFEFTAGVSPVDPLARFRLSIRGVAGAPDHVALVFSPRFADRTYTVFVSTHLASGTWTPLSATSPVSDNGLERTVTDTNATGPRKFYRVQIDRP